jgi:hypothetical protein
MRVRKLIRKIVSGNELKDVADNVYNDCNIVFDINVITLAGPKYAHIATGLVKDIRTTFNHSPYHMQIQVLVQEGADTSRYHQEHWFIVFNNID